MLDFAKNETEEKTFIVDIECNDKEMIIKYADGRESHEPYTLHNYNVYRIRMEDQAKENLDYAYDEIAKDSFLVYVKRLIAIIGGIIAGIVIYNVDIHIIIKIILALLILLGEVLYYLYNEIYLSVLADDLQEVSATDYYLKNIDKFKYYDSKIGENGYIVPIEDLDKHHLTPNQLEQIATLVTEYRDEGVDNSDIRLTYTNPNA